MGFDYSASGIGQYITVIPLLGAAVATAPSPDSRTGRRLQFKKTGQQEVTSRATADSTVSCVSFLGPSDCDLSRLRRSPLNVSLWELSDLRGASAVREGCATVFVRVNVNGSL